MLINFTHTFNRIWNSLESILNCNLNAQDLCNDRLNGIDRLLDYRLARKAFRTRDNASCCAISPTSLDKVSMETLAAKIFLRDVLNFSVFRPTMKRNPDHDEIDILIANRCMNSARSIIC